MRVIGWCAPKNGQLSADLHDLPIKKILLVRANFRMGNAILALPAIAGFQKNFPGATIDFVGSPMSNLLFQYQPLQRHYIAPRRFPRVFWQYLRLIRQLRAKSYDLAVDVSCSQSAVGAFIVGVSGARIRAGLSGKWDRLFNVKVLKLKEENKYAKLSEFFAGLGLALGETWGALKFSPAEKLDAVNRLDVLFETKQAKKIGVFVGGRKLRGKRWPVANFIDVINGLDRSDVRVIVFLGPEETDLADPLRRSLTSITPIICEPSVRKFAALISNLDLFICCDSGPMHLACAVGVPVLAIFQERDVSRWAPPPSTARTLYGSDGVSAAQVLNAALEELARSGSTEAAPTPPAIATAAGHA